MSATADRSARAIQRSLFMAAMVIRGFSWASRERGRETSRELREKPLISVLNECVAESQSRGGVSRLVHDYMSPPGMHRAARLASSSLLT